MAAQKRNKTQAPSSKKVLKKTGTKKSSRTRSTATSVVLPVNVNRKMLEKAHVLNREFDHHFRNAMYRIAYVSGFCFLLVGVALVASDRFSASIPHQEAQLITSNLSTTVADTEFTLLTDIPEQINEPLPVTFVITNTKLVETKLTSIETDLFLDLKVSEVLDDKYEIIIPTDELPAGWYYVRIQAWSETGETPVVYELPTFHVGSNKISPESETTSKNETTSDELATETETTTNATEEIVTITDSTEKALIETGPTLSSPAGAILSNVAILQISDAKELSAIELYARPANSLTSRFVTSAIKRLDQWQFVFDTKNIPNGEYHFHAQIRSSAGTHSTEPLKLTIRNEVPKVAAATDDVADEIKLSNIVEIRPLIKTEPTESTPARTFVSDAVEETDRLLDENSASLNDLLQRYAVAKQSGDEMLIQAAREALEEKRQEIVRNTLQDLDVRDIADSIDKELSNRVTDLENRVNTFEELRHNRTGGESAIDTDQDGISDFDERTLYGTDPTSADSDNDGVTDGIEIVRGYDPNDAATEAVIDFESPKESIGLVRSETLVINEVLPVTQVETEDRGPQVTAEIRGKGLPNSFVTLYIFSTPTVVTVRTDADGNFVYAFNKELEDGQHDVYVAMTDNAGDIIAQSNRFSFIKEAQAFTPVNADQADMISTEPITETTKNTYNIVLGMGILALGIILLMLGISLRKPEKETGDGEQKERSLTDSIQNPAPPKNEHIDAS